MIPFFSQKEAWGPEVPPLAGLRAKSIGSSISDFELRISDFLRFFFNPHSAIHNPQSRLPARPKKRSGLMIFAPKARASGPGRD